MDVIAQVTPLGVRRGDSAALARARTAFRDEKCVRLPRFLDPSLLHWFRTAIAQAAFVTRVHTEVDVRQPVELVVQSHDIDSRLHFLLNDRELFRLVEDITGCAPIGNYLCRVYQMVPGMGHFDEWHRDVDGNRLVTLSINLGEPYEGGVLQIADWQTRTLVHEVANTGPGDAILFAIAPELGHRVTDVTGSVPKLACAGWFRRRPDYAAIFPRRPASGN